MEQIKEFALNKAVKILDSLNLKYHIINPDGNDIYGGGLEPEAKQKPKRKNPSKTLYPRGTFTKIFRQHNVHTMQSGDVVEIPFGKIQRKIMRQNLCLFAQRLWGSSSYVLNTTRENLQIMRVS